MAIPKAEASLPKKVRKTVQAAEKTIDDTIEERFPEHEYAEIEITPFIYGNDLESSEKDSVMSELRRRYESKGWNVFFYFNMDEGLQLILD